MKVIVNEPSDLNRYVRWADSFDTSMVLVSNSSADQISSYSSYDIMVATGVAKSVGINPGSDFFNDLKGFLNDNQDWIFGHFGYDLKNMTEKLSSDNIDLIQFPDGFFFIPENIIQIKDNKEITLKQNKKSHFSNFDNFKYSDEKENLISWSGQTKSRIDSALYLKSIEHLKDHIKRGDIFEVNYCYEYYCEEIHVDPVKVFCEINKDTQMPFAGFYKHKQKYLLCFSPERFLRKEQSKIISQPMKGTIRKGNNEEENLSLMNELQTNQKERSENIMITDLVRNDLSKSAINGTVRVEELCRVYEFRKINQMISTVSCLISGDSHPVDVIRNSFPMGSMTGAPKVKAMELIEKYEETRRGLYSGSIGYFTPEQDFDFNVVIRSICYNKPQNYLNFMVGSAITSLSEPNKELEECKLKARIINDWLKRYTK